MNNMKTILKIITAIALVLIGSLLPIKTEAHQFLSLQSNIDAFSSVTNKIRIIGVEVEKCLVDNDKVVKFVDKDTLTFFIFNAKNIFVESKRLGFCNFFSGNCQYSQETINGKSTNGINHILTRETFAFKENQGFVYTRPKGNGLVAPCLQVFDKGFRYAYNIHYAEKYNPKNGKWEHINIWVDNANADYVLNFLKLHFVK